MVAVFTHLQRQYIKLFSGIRFSAKTCGACILSRAKTGKYSWQIISLLVLCQGVLTGIKSLFFLIFFFFKLFSGLLPQNLQNLARGHRAFTEENVHRIVVGSGKSPPLPIPGEGSLTGKGALTRTNSSGMIFRVFLAWAFCCHIWLLHDL